MSLKLPNDKIVYNLPEQVGVNAENIKYLAEKYKEIDSIPAEFAVMKAYYDDVMFPAFSTWTTTFEGWTQTLDTYLANMSSAAVGAIAGQTIAPSVVNATTSIDAPAITGNSIIETPRNYTFQKHSGVSYAYAGICKNGNKITFAIACTLNWSSIPVSQALATIVLPLDIYNNLFPMTYGGSNNILSVKSVCLYKNENEFVPLNVRFVKSSSPGYVTITLYPLGSASIDPNTDYILRYEETFLLSENLAA